MSPTKDITSKRFGKLIVITSTKKRTANGGIVWECICDCGNTCFVPTGSLNNGGTKSCGCLRRVDLKNKRFGKLVALESTRKRKDSGCIVWRCVCDCGGEKLVPTSLLLKRKTKSCGCVNRNALPEGEAAFNTLYSNYKRNAKEKNREFELTEEQFRKLTSSNCTYCGVKPEQIIRPSDYLYNGVDRIDNNEGYILENCVPCCKFCNIVKNRFNKSEFTRWLKRISNYYNNRSEQMR